MRKKPVILFIHFCRPKVWTILPALLLLGMLTVPGWWSYSQAVLSPADHSLRGRVIVIDPGHGGTDPGAICAGVMEKHINLDISKRVAQLLKQKGAKITLTRTTDVDFYVSGLGGSRRDKKRSELDQRVRMAESLKADVFLSIHSNKDRHPNCYGMETFYHSNSTNGRLAAAAVQDELRRLQPRNRRLAKAGDYYLLRNTAMPALLIEVGFLSHYEERALLQTPAYRQKIAEAIVAGLQKYYANDQVPVDVLPEAGLKPSPSAPVLSPDFKELKLWFSSRSDTGDCLLPENRELGLAVGTNLSSFGAAWVPGPTLALEELLKGPATSGLEPVFPPGTRLVDIELADGLAVVTFSRELADNFSGNLEAEYNLLVSVYRTLSQFPGIAEVELRAEGRPNGLPGGHLLLNRPFKPTEPGGPKIAIIIDDLGQGGKGTEEMLALPYPITFAVMPNLEKSREEARSAVRKGHQVIVHMPMAPEVGKASWLGPGAITSDLDPDEVGRRVSSALLQLPEAVGLSNHTGSKITADPQIMKVILRQLKSRNLFIVDSRTTERSVVPQVAREIGVPWAKRDVFLDNIKTTAAIKKQLLLLEAEARQKGQAIGIGHVGQYGDHMAEALKECLPEMKERGINFVFVSQMLNYP